MSDFKDFLLAIKGGKNRRDLFLYKHKHALQTAMVELCDEANELGMYPIVKRAQQVVVFGNSFAKMRVVHPAIDERMRGLTFTGVHNLDALDGFENEAAMAQNLLAQVR